MSDVFDAISSPEEAFDAATAALANGGLVVLPTDTVYGVGADPRIPGATGRVFEAKGRSWDLTLPVLAGGPEDAQLVARFDARAHALADAFWPGGLTLVLPRSEESLAWELGDESDTVGVRVPADEVAGALLARTGPLAVTSANRSGEPTPRSCDEVQEALADSVEVYLCAGTLMASAPSTIVDLTGPDLRILRPGAVDPRRILDALS
jgi:tRNA threonylcarbamoyl adenosine modification protein (Sua5/YciO/YrdC/YwlC family)